MVPLIEWPAIGRMTRGLLLDSHALLWLDGEAPISPLSLFEIGRARKSQTLFHSHMSMWEIGLALHKKNFERRPDLRGLSVGVWFNDVAADFEIQSVAISDVIALAAAEVPSVYGFGDPGDCFLIATAHIENLSLVTRDARMIELANRRPDYITVIPC